MGAQEVIANTVEEKLKLDGFSSYDEMSDTIIQSLQTNGYVILSPDEVRGIRDEALEEAARTSDQHPGVKFTNHNGRQDWRPPCRVEIAAAIRSLKGGRDVA